MMDFVAQEVGNYMLLRLLGRGSSADVYLAKHKSRRSYVAMKIYKALAAKVWGERRDNEIAMLSRLAHPHIVRMHEYGRQDSFQFLVMDWATGGRLLDLFAQTIPIDLVVTYVQQIASALHYLHMMHVVHRDIKPANILIERRGHVLLADFELAVDYKDCQSTIGNVAYAAPEQIQGQPCPASDQYALAAMTYQWLCGELPFRGTSDEMVAQHRYATPPSIREKVPMLPSAIEEVFFTALAKNSNSRFVDIQTFALSFEQILQSSSYWTPSQVLRDFGTGDG